MFGGKYKARIAELEARVRKLEEERVGLEAELGAVQKQNAGYARRIETLEAQLERQPPKIATDPEEGEANKKPRRRRRRGRRKGVTSGASPTPAQTK